MEEFFRMRTSGAWREDMLEVLRKAGKGRAPSEGDELPSD
jgi:hypothetical protein